MNEAVLDDRPAADRLTPEDLPRVALFLSAYLHEDLVPEHGSAAGAAYDYAAAAELDELEELAREWRIVIAASRSMSLEQLNRTLRSRFASSWRAVSLEEVAAVGAELDAALRE